VGEAGSSGRDAAELSRRVRGAYEAAAQTWPGGPAAVYQALATSLVSQTTRYVAGARVLDIGAGTGAVSRAALAAGAAEVVAADLAVGALRAGAQLRAARPAWLPVVADAAALPFCDDSFGLVLAGFSLTHAERLDVALSEARRVGPVLAASSFAPGWTHPAKAAVDAVLTRFGYRPPSWYRTLKHDTEPGFSDAGLFRRLALAAGFTDCQSMAVTVPTGLSAPRELAAWRLGMAHIGPFVRSLDPARQGALRQAAEAAIGGGDPLVVGMLVHLAES
jgi:ubiquinone/menaquinone biosynthesis C-methylase UbiE